MKLEEVLPALRAGKKIRCPAGVSGGLTLADCTYDSLAQLLEGSSAVEFESDQWEVVEEPATDEELAAAFERVAQQYGKESSAYGALLTAADMVRKRYVDPSWKPADKMGK